MNFFQTLRRKIWSIVEKSECSINDVVALQIMQTQLTVYLAVTPLDNMDIRERRETEAFALFLNKALKRALVSQNIEGDTDTEATES